MCFYTFHVFLLTKYGEASIYEMAHSNCTSHDSHQANHECSVIPNINAL